jgi:electron transfer flavoprotein alpha subunit
MQESEKILAINLDHKAPMFEVCDYGIVGDLFQVVPELTRQLRERKAVATVPQVAR